MKPWKNKKEKRGVRCEGCLHGETSHGLEMCSDMVGIKGHRSVGGFRASLYNACPKESVEALVACMQEFENLHK